MIFSKLDLGFFERNVQLAGFDIVDWKVHTFVLVLNKRYAL